ncbi:MAG: tetratricopeptide repeat protein, partial [Chloroflexi bacterium]|nr:tetratricopeptide repeat protein [Chloroflexota bacterium]
MKATLGALSAFLLVAGVACATSPLAAPVPADTRDVESVASASTSAPSSAAPATGSIASPNTGSGQEPYTTRAAPAEAAQTDLPAESIGKTSPDGLPGNEVKIDDVGLEPPSEAEAAFRAARELFSQGMWRDAADEFARVLALDSESSDSYYYRGRSLFYLGEVDLAASDLTSALGLDPDHVEAYYFRGRSYRVIGDD